MNAKRAALVLAVMCLLLPACGEIRLNRAMERVNDRYVSLFYVIETGGFIEIRDAARGLAEALADPAIEEYRDESDYQRLLGESSDAAGRIETEAVYQEGTKGRDSLLALRSRVSHSCQACHEEYRRLGGEKQ